MMMMMTITFNPYLRRDGSLMLYINRSNKVSIGISADRAFAAYGRGSTQGQRNAFSAARRVIREHGKPFVGDLEQHSEAGHCAPVRLANGWTLVGTDVASLGGMRAPSGDGGYLVADGLVVPLGVALAEPDDIEEAA